MKNRTQGITTKLFVLFTALLSSFYAIAQDGSTTTQSSTNVSHTESSNISPDTTMWYSNPVVWVVGAIVLLIIIIVAARSGKKTVSDTEVKRTTTTTTTIKED